MAIELHHFGSAATPGVGHHHTDTDFFITAIDGFIRSELGVSEGRVGQPETKGKEGPRLRSKVVFIERNRLLRIVGRQLADRAGHRDWESTTGVGCTKQHLGNRGAVTLSEIKGV